MEKVETLEDLFLTVLSDIYNVENRLEKAVAALNKKAYSNEVKEAMAVRLSETKQQIAKLDQVFATIGEKPETVDWISSMAAIFEKSRNFFETTAPSPLLDTCLVVIGQKIEHYEMATYNTLITLADALGYDKAKTVLKSCLKTECKADKLLESIASKGDLAKAAKR